MKFTIAPAILAAVAAIQFALPAQASWIEKFTKADPNTGLPVNWVYKTGPIGVRDAVFTLVDEPTAVDGKALRLDCDSASGTILANPSNEVNLKKTPFLRWRWRIVTPTKDTTQDDQAVVIYLGAQEWLRNKSVGYRWESDNALGTQADYSYAGGLVKAHTYCLRNKSTPPGEWVTETVNIAEAFQKAYNYLPTAFAVTVGCNTQHTESHSIAEVDYIEFLTPEEAAKAPAEEKVDEELSANPEAK